MLRSIKGIFLVVFTLLMVGCTWLRVPQQPRPEITESARMLVVRPQGLFVAPQRMMVNQLADGAVTVRAVARTTTSLAASFDATLSQLDDAILPFLFPACQIPIEADQR